MKKLLICFLFLTAAVGAQTYIPSPSTPRLMNEKGYISDSNPLPVASSGGSSEGILASETIGLLDAIDSVKQAVEGLVVDTSAVVAAIEEQGKNASQTALINTMVIGNSKLNDIWVNTNGLKTLAGALNKTPTIHITRKITLEANTVQAVSSALNGSMGQETRLYIEITTMNADDEFWLNLDGYPAAIGETRRVVGGIGMELPRLTTVSLIASQSIDVFVLEAGR